MPKCLGQHRTIKIGASYWPISAICRSSSLKFCDFLRICFIWFLLIGNECFWVFLLYLFQQVHAVSEKNITHNSSPFWQGSPFRQEISKKIEMSWNIQRIRIVFFQKTSIRSVYRGAGEPICAQSQTATGGARNFSTSWGSPSNVRFVGKNMKVNKINK